MISLWYYLIYLLVYFMRDVKTAHYYGANDDPSTASSNKVYRLPKSVRPFRYFLTVEPNLEAEFEPIPYNGSVIIELMTVENTRNITLHARQINIDRHSIKVTDDDETEIEVTQTESKNKGPEETYTIFLKGELIKGRNYTLTIGKFNSYLGTENVGFYLAKYKHYLGHKRRLAVTDFEPNDARQAFPCFDEPDFKARFIINLIRTEEYNSLSNSELEKTIELGDGRYQDCYKETIEMSTYVVAFIISDFEPTHLMERHRIFARPGSVVQGKLDYTLDVSVKTLKFLEEYTGVKFPIKKMDQFAIPDEYFKDDAMENWGLVIYGESHLFCTNMSTVEELKTCTVYIAHEFGHQWFGNLVTPSWWTYTWLSESFAAFFQYFAASKIQPSWRLMDQMVIDILHKALDKDDTNFLTTSLNYEITYNGEFPSFWLLYQKGSSIIRMMQHFLTHDVFQRGLHYFLESRKYKTAKPSDLYNALQTAAKEAGLSYHLLGNLNLDTILSSWDSEQGYPVVNVARDYETGILTFSQTKYVKSEGEKLKKETLWHIPISYAFSSDPVQKFWITTADFWLSDKQKTIETNSMKSDWLLVNIQQTGYYRVNYDTKNWERLVDVLKNGDFEKIPVLNRAQLLDDAFDLARSKYLPFDIAFRLSEYLVRERDYIPFGAFFDFIDHMEFLLPYQSSNVARIDYLYFGDYYGPNFIFNNVSGGEYELFKEYGRYILGPIYEHIGFEEKPTDGFLDKKLRAMVVTWLCNNEHVGCINDAVKLFRRFKNDTTTYIPPDLQNTVFCKGVTSQADWNFLAATYLSNRCPKLLDRKIYYGLSCNVKYSYGSAILGIKGKN